MKKIKVETKTKTQPSTERLLNAFRLRYLQWGNITVPYGSSRRDRGHCVYHLPNRKEEADPFKALSIMYDIYIEQGIKVNAAPPTKANVLEYLETQADGLSCAQASLNAIFGKSA